MARSRKRVKRKSNVRNSQCPQPVGAPRNQNTNRKITETEQTCIPHKRRRSTRYNLRQSNSVILVSETPCCQTPELQEKYTKLGLNSALFLKGTQRPKRKQSHISIITISSDDEETSEERTSEWVNSLSVNYWASVEPEQKSDSEIPEQKEESFQPLCSSTPNTSQYATQYQLNNKWKKGEEFDTLPLSCREASTECRLDEVNEPQELCCFGSTSSAEDLRNQTRPLNDPAGQEQTFQLVISIPDSLTNSQSVQYQPDESKKAENSGPSSPVPSAADRVETFNEAKESAHKNAYQDTGSTSSSLCFRTPVNSGSGNFENIKPIEEPATAPCFYFGSSTDTTNINSTLASPFESYFNSSKDISTSSGFKLGSPTLNEGNGETNLFNMSDTNMKKNTNSQTDSHSVNSDNLDCY